VEHVAFQNGNFWYNQRRRWSPIVQASWPESSIRQQGRPV